MEQKEFEFEAFVYKNHFQAAIVSLFFFIVIVVAPFYIITNFIWTEWKDINSSFRGNLIGFGIIILPLGIFLLYFLKTNFKKKLIATISNDKILIKNRLSDKIILKTQVTNTSLIKVVERRASEYDRTFHFQFNQNKNRLVLWSGKKYNEQNIEFIKFELFKHFLEEHLNTLGLKKETNSSYKGKVIKTSYKLG